MAEIGASRPLPRVPRRSLDGTDSGRSALTAGTRAHVQVMCRFLGRLHGVAIHVRRRQASEKRQGTKSRLVGSGGWSRGFGGFGAAGGAGVGVRGGGIGGGGGGQGGGGERGGGGGGRGGGRG